MEGDLYIWHHTTQNYPTVFTVDPDNDHMEGPLGGGPRTPRRRVMVGTLIPTSYRGWVHKSLYMTSDHLKVGWCASQWYQPLPERIWEMTTLFLTGVKWDNLKFANTAFEHRYNCITTKDPSPQLEILAKNEFLLWGPHHKELVPFKDAHPHGYQGVYGNYNGALNKAIRSSNSLPSWMIVVDAFNPNHLLEFDFVYISGDI